MDAVDEGDAYALFETCLATHAALFRYFAPLVAESQRVLAALPSDGAHDPKVRLPG